MAKGEERRVVSVDHKARNVELEAPTARTSSGNRRGSEVYQSEDIELCTGNRIRWTKNDAGFGLVNSRTAQLVAVEDGKVSFRLEEGRTLEQGGDDLALRHLNHAWASTVHALKGRTVKNVIAAMEAGNPHLTTQKSFYVEISRAKDTAQLVTDVRERLKEHLEQATGETFSALEGIQPKAPVAEKGREGPAPSTEMTLDADGEIESVPVPGKGMDKDWTRESGANGRLRLISDSSESAIWGTGTGVTGRSATAL